MIQTREMDDRTLVQQSPVGDRGAFEQIYRRHVSRVYTFLVWTAADEHEAEDLTQEVFIKAWKNLPHFRYESSLSTWLTRIAINAYRARRRTLTRRINRETTAFEICSDAQSDSEGSREALIDLAAAIRGLPRRAKSVLILYEIQGRRHAEIASIMGISEGTSKAQLNRAKRLLRKELER